MYGDSSATTVSYCQMVAQYYSTTCWSEQTHGDIEVSFLFLHMKDMIMEVVKKGSFYQKYKINH